ncbi:Protein FAR1-RELATED SEQUENCE 5 [Glycine max]|nr:Protein FAR1-RELATED SEQUENCE 5 [Glycine max]
MNTTQRNEGINAFFDSFVHSRTTLQEFVVKFEKTVDCRLEVEKREDYESRHKFRILSTGSKLEHHAAFVYTRNVFGKFQNELRKINEFTKKKIRRDGPSYVFQVSNLDSKVAKCDCQLFEFMGILCRHIFVIFQAKGVVQIPDHFVLQRWTKDANKCIEVSDAENNFDGLSITPRILRRMHAQQQASILVDLVEESKEIYRFIVLELGQTHKSVIVMKTSLPLLESSLTIGNKLCMPEHVSEVPHLILRDPHISQTKGRKKDGKKLKSGLEVSLNKSLVKRKACHECGEHGHNSKTCKKKNLND